MKNILKLTIFYLSKKNKKYVEKVSTPVGSNSIWWLATATIFKLIILIFFGLLILFPFYYMVSTSLMTHFEAAIQSQTKLVLVPETPQWGNYGKAFAEGYWQAMLISFSIAAITIALKVFITILLGYAFAYKNFRFKKIFWGFFLSMLMLPEVALLSGQYQMVVLLDWHYGTNVLVGIFAPFIASVFNALMFRNAFESIPEQTKEASRVDGARETIYFFKIAIPMIKPTLWTVVVLTAFASWNSYMWPALLLQQSGGIQVIPTWVFLTGRDDENQMIIPIRMAGTVLAIMPMFIVYFVFRRRIMKAIASRGVATKG